MRWRWPSPSWRLVALFGAVTGLGLLGVLVGVPWSAALALDALLALAFAIDAWRGRQASLEAVRRLPRPLRAFAANPIELELRSALPYPVQVRFLDQTPPSLACQGHTGQLELQPGDVASLSYTATGPRGSVAFGDLHLLLAGPWGLAVWPSQVRLAEASQVVPDLRDREDALAQARARPEAGLARLRRLGEGRELDSLRMYRQGDDVRQVDWKASAKRGELVSREYTPEKNQVVWLLLDCGRQMVVQEGARTRLDWAIEGALRLARSRPNASSA